MKAPDIIYTDGRNTCAPAPIFSNADGNVKYIREDALLEWAKEKANDYKGVANIRRSFEMMIRKIESL